MDVVYPLKAGGSRFDDRELRLSLRGVEANLQLEVGQVYLIGHRPAWIDGVIHIPAVDRRDKAVNLRDKYATMLTIPELSDPFLLMDDDHIFLKPTAEIPLCTKGPLALLCRQYRAMTHGRYLQNALNELTALGLPSLNYQIHFPMLIDKGTLRQAVKLMKKPMVMASLYGNIRNARGDRQLTVEVERDFRINTADDFNALREGRFISFSPRVEDNVLAFAESRLPAASRWERVARVAA